jgi:hypothetical protein
MKPAALYCGTLPPIIMARPNYSGEKRRKELEKQKKKEEKKRRKLENASAPATDDDAATPAEGDEQSPAPAE